MGSKCRRTSSRSRSSPSIGATSSWRASIPNWRSSLASAVRPAAPATRGGPRARRTLEWRSFRGDRLARRGRAAGSRVPLGRAQRRWWSGDEIELLLELGRIEDAIRLLDVWEADAARVAREWVSAQATRCRGLVAAARGHRSRRFPPRQGDCAARGGRRPFARLVHCSGSASSGGGTEEARPARRSRLRSTVSNSSGPRPGSKRLAASLGESAGAGARRADACRAPRRRPGCRRPHKPGGRRCALRHGADGRRSLIPCLRQAWRALANGACPSAAVSISWRGGS